MRNVQSALMRWWSWWKWVTFLTKTSVVDKQSIDFKFSIVVLSSFSLTPTHSPVPWHFLILDVAKALFSCSFIVVRDVEKVGQFDKEERTSREKRLKWKSFSRIKFPFFSLLRTVENVIKWNDKIALSPFSFSLLCFFSLLQLLLLHLRECQRELVNVSWNPSEIS